MRADPSPAPGVLRLLLAGDVMTGRGIDQVLPHPGAPWLLESHVKDARGYVRLAEAASGPVAAPVMPDYPWGDALAEMAGSGADLRIANLETAVTACDEPWPGKGIHYRMHPDNMPCLRASGFDAWTLANNHVLDWGRAGLAETLASLARAGQRSAGAGPDAPAAWAPAVLPAPGGRLLLFSIATESSGVPAAWAAAAGRSGVALVHRPDAAAAGHIADAVAQARRPGDRVVVSLHWGANWGLHILPAHRAFARRLVDLGAADVVHGHSSHHPLAIEVYRGRAILYGCGDLLNDYEGIGGHGSLRCDVACLYLLTLDEAGELEQLRIAPFRIRRLRLERADAPARAWLERVFASDPESGTRTEVLPEGGWLLRWPG